MKLYYNEHSNIKFAKIFTLTKRVLYLKIVKLLRRRFFLTQLTGQFSRTSGNLNCMEIEIGGERMKRTVIGGFIMIGGIFTTLTIILMAVMYMPSMTSWTGSQLWYAIFGEKRRQYGIGIGGEAVQSLFLGFPFVVGLLLTILGLVILAKEYFDKSFLK